MEQSHLKCIVQIQPSYPPLCHKAFPHTWPSSQSSQTREPLSILILTHTEPCKIQLSRCSSSCSQLENWVWKKTKSVGQKTWAVLGTKDLSIFHSCFLSTQSILQITVLCFGFGVWSVVEEVATINQLAKQLTFFPVLNTLRLSLQPMLSSPKQEDGLPAMVLKGNPRKATPCMLHGDWIWER